MGADMRHFPYKQLFKTISLLHKHARGGFALKQHRQQHAHAHVMLLILRVSRDEGFVCSGEFQPLIQPISNQ